MRVYYYELPIFRINCVVPINVLPFSAFNVPNFLTLPRDNICTYLMLFDSSGHKKNITLNVKLQLYCFGDLATPARTERLYGVPPANLDAQVSSSSLADGRNRLEFTFS